MKKFLIALTIFATPLLADEMLLRTGEKLTYTKVLKIDPDGLRLLVPDGVKKVAYGDMTDATRTKYGLTEEKAEKYREKQEEKVKQSAVEDATEQAQAVEKQAAAVEKKAKTPRIITAEQMKAHWISQIAKPGTLESDYRGRMERYESMIVMINSGKYAAIAQEKTLSWNISEYERTGQPDVAARLRKDLEEVRKRISEAAQLEQESQALALERAQTELERERLIISARVVEAQTRAIDSLSSELRSLNSKLR